MERSTLYLPFYYMFLPLSCTYKHKSLFGIFKLLLLQDAAYLREVLRYDNLLTVGVSPQPSLLYANSFILIYEYNVMLAYVL